MKKLALIVALPLFIVLVSCGPKDPIVTTWLQSEIIGQGKLVAVDNVNSRWLISLELMSAKSTPEQIVIDTFVYYLDGDLRVGSSYMDTKVFKLGYYYVLYRKIEGTTTQFYLSQWQDVRKEAR